MVKMGFCQPGDNTKHLPPLTGGNEAAIHIWNKLGSEVRFPDVLYLMAVEGVDDEVLMLERLYALRDVLKDG